MPVNLYWLAWFPHRREYVEAALAKESGMNHPSVIQPALLSRINERRVLRTLQARGSMSRAQVARHAGISPPTASRAVESLLKAGFLEELGPTGSGRGRPARVLQLARDSVQVLGVVIDAVDCTVVASGLDGTIDVDRTVRFATPHSYADLLDVTEQHVKPFLDTPGVVTLGVAFSSPGLVDYRLNRGILSPNVPITNNRSISRDLAARFGVACIMVQELHALCLAERHYGSAKPADDFALLDATTGVGLGVMSGGHVLTGHSGLAGEVGHITVVADGRSCGCGNTGCLETVASDSAVAWMVSQRLGKPMTIESVLAGAAAGTITVEREISTACTYLAIGVAAVINLFNPSTLFIHSQWLNIQADLFQRLVAETLTRALPPSFNDCRIIQSRASKRQGAVAAIIEHITNSVVPIEQVIQWPLGIATVGSTLNDGDG